MAHFYGHVLGTFLKFMGTFWVLLGTVKGCERQNQGEKKPLEPFDLSGFLAVFDSL